jgi:hypothetical protein
MGNKGADEFIWLGKSYYVLQSPLLRCAVVVCMHRNYSVMVRSEITRFRILLCGLELSSLKHDTGVVSCNRDHAPTGCIQHIEFLGSVKEYYTSRALFISVSYCVCIFIYLIFILLKTKYVSLSR